MGRVGVAQPEFWGREGGGQWQGRGSSDQEERDRAALESVLLLEELGNLWCMGVT